MSESGPPSAPEGDEGTPPATPTAGPSSDPGPVAPPPGGSGPPTAPRPPGGFGPPTAPPPPGAYGRPSPGPQFGTPQFGTPQFGQQPQFGTPGYGQAPGAGGLQPPAAPYTYGSGIPSSAELASPGRRIGGYLLDLLILTVGLAVVWIPAIIVLVNHTSTRTAVDVSPTRDLEGTDLTLVLAAYALSFLVPVLYQIVFVALKGQTPGAMIVKVKVVRLSDGQTPGWGPAIMRWLPNLAGVLCSLITLGLYIWALVNLFNNELRQTPFDLAAKTVVIDVS